jgi:hypothetical protein
LAPKTVQTGGLERRSRSYIQAAMSLSPRLLAALVVAATLVPAAWGAGSPAMPASYPAAGELVAMQLAVRSEPDPSAPVIRYLHQFPSDFRRQVVFALDA